jgi:hypothetical protein
MERDAFSLLIGRLRRVNVAFILSIGTSKYIFSYLKGQAPDVAGCGGVSKYDFDNSPAKCNPIIVNMNYAMVRVR